MSPTVWAALLRILSIFSANPRSGQAQTLVKCFRWKVKTNPFRPNKRLKNCLTSWQRCSKLDRTVFVGVSESRFHFPLSSNDHLAATKWNNNLVFPFGWMNNIITNHQWYLSLQVALTKTNILIKLSAIHHTCCDFLK